MYCHAFRDPEDADFLPVKHIWKKMQDAEKMIGKNTGGAGEWKTESPSLAVMLQ